MSQHGQYLVEPKIDEPTQQWYGKYTDLIYNNYNTKHTGREFFFLKQVDKANNLKHNWN